MELTTIMKIVSGLILSIGSLFFVILLMISYFSKERFLSVRNKLYRYLLITVIFLLVTEIIASLYFAYDNHNKFIYLVILKIHWSTGIIWPTILYFYSFSFLKQPKENSVLELIKKYKRCKYILFFSIVSFIVYLILPLKYGGYNEFTYIPGTAAIFMISYCALIVVLILSFMILKAKEAPFRKKISTVIMIFEAILIFGFQLLYQDIAFIGLGAALQMFFLYFNIENPDIEIVNELETVKNDIEKSSRAKSDFLLNMSNEIKSPMNSIIGISQTVANSTTYDEKEVKDSINNIINAGNNLLDIINNILDISKIESGEETLEQREYNSNTLFSELSDIISTRIGEKPVKFILNIDENIPSVLYGDYTKLFQILLNILTNSVKYTEVGKIVLHASCEIKDKNCLLHFKVTDTGYGIKKEDYDKLFEKFARLDSAKSNEIEGTGLGLVITKKYVDLMNGIIRFESDYGVGTTFFVDVTQRIINQNSVNKNSLVNTSNNLEYIDCSKYTVLVVDDNNLNLKVAQRLLSKYNFTVETLNTGKECVYNIKAGKKYDMIFLDHMMPEMDGIRVLHILRKLEDYELPPIVALTANAITGMKEMYLKEGFDEYLSKPINISELNKIINKYFNKDYKN